MLIRTSGDVGHDHRNRRSNHCRRPPPAGTATDRAEVQREEPLNRTAALQDAILNSATFCSIATDAKGIIQIFNHGAERMLGYEAVDVIGLLTPADLSDPQELIARSKALSAELETPIGPGFDALVFKASRGIEDIYELTYVRKDSSRFPAVVSVTALRDAKDSIIGYLLIGTDNTAREQVEEEKNVLDQRLRDQQFYTRSLFESSMDALMTTDPHGIITDVNKQMEILTGCTRDELIGAPFKHHFTDPERAQAGIKRVLTEKKVINYELTARSRDGTETVVSYNATTFYDRDRRLKGVFAAARDITERIALVQALEERNAQLEAANQELEDFGWVNLLGNAVKFTRQRPTAHIEVGGQTQGGECLYWVKDDGAGFDMQYADKLFAVFQRLHGEDEFEGVGAGLAIVARIVARHQGRIWGEGKPDAGATLHFALPLPPPEDSK